MNREVLEQAADELRCSIGNRFDLAMLTLVETLTNLDDDSECSWLCGDVDIRVTHKNIVLIDTKANKTILSLEVNYNGS